MKKHVKEIILIVSVIICAVIALKYSRAVVVSMRQNRSGAEAESAAETVSENTDLNDEIYMNEEFFYGHAEDQGINHSEAGKYWEMLLADDVFKNDTMRLTGLVIDDMDDNGQNDLLVMIIDRENWAIHGSGCVWIYMNEDEPYCFDAENGSYYGYFDFFAEDIDNDGNAELVLCTHGWGTGLEDICKVIFKYKNHNLEQMELPSDLETDYDQGICVEVYQKEEKDRYSAYCPYFDEEILFEAENIANPDGMQINAGSNVRGFYNLSPVKYQGKNALQASEYLSGEGGTVHYVATAQFIILWDKNGHSYVDKWWIEAKENTYANNKGSRITYADGYYYYASQLDHYYLYRVKEDGSEAVCLAKVHPGTIQVDGDCIYFVNLSDHNAIYRIGTDGSGMVRLCDSSGNHMQLTEEYIFFRSAYEKEWDIHGLVSDETDAAVYYGTDGCLYRMHKDGSGKELLLINVRNCILAPVSGSEIKYEGHIYCGKSQQNETTGQNETHVMVYDLDGNNIGEVCRFDFKGDILVCGGRIYCYSPYEENGKICMYATWDKEMTVLPDKMLTDCCIYKGSLYGLTEEIDQEKRITQIYRLSPDTGEWQMVYSNTALCTAADGHGVIDNRGTLADIYATEQGVFLRQFVSSKEGVRWFAVGEEKGAVSWEDETQEPEIYERFLNGELTVEKEQEQVYISELFWDNDIEYCFCDIDGDGSEELHIRDSAGYYIIKICDETPQILLENWWGYEPVVTDELCGILYYSQGYGEESIEFIRISADGSKESEGEYRWNDEDKNGSMDEEDSFSIDYSQDIDMERYVQYRDELLAKQAENKMEWKERRLKSYVAWQEAYIDFLEKPLSTIWMSEDGWDKYSLIYVDDDDIPELYISTGYSVGGEFVVSFYDGNVRAMNRYRGGIKYIEYGGLLYSDWGHMGLYPFNIYMLVKGEFSEIGTGWYCEYYDDENEDIYWEYFWEGKEVTEAEYEGCINGLIDTSQCTEPPELYTREEILDILAESDTN